MELQNKEPTIEISKFCFSCIDLLINDIEKGGSEGKRFSELDKYGWLYNLVVDPYHYLEKHKTLISLRLYEEIIGVTEGMNLFEYSFSNPNKKLLSKFIIYLKTTEATSYDCEQLFSQLKQFKSEKRNRLSNESLLLQLTLFELKNFEIIKRTLGGQINPILENRINKRNMYYENLQQNCFLSDTKALFSFLE